MLVPDALVVGAGPAGSIAALLLARAGLRVQLIDRCTFPRHKLCGDTINPGSMGILRSLDQGWLPHAGVSCHRRIHADVRAQARPIDGMLVTGPGGVSVRAWYPRGARGASILRRDLDLLLLEQAIAAGAGFEPGLSARTPLMDDAGTAVVGVRAVKDGRAYALRARIVVAADGRASRLARCLGLSRFAARPRRWAFGAYFTDVEGTGALGEMHVRTGGYVGIAPLPGAAVNVCVVRAVTGEWRITPDEARDPALMIREAVAADPALRDRFADARRISEVIALGPLAVESSAAGCHGLLLAGDAAGFVDPMTGDGLRFAMRGGMIAATAAIAELASGVPAFGTVTETHRREFGRKRFINNAIRTLVGSPRGVAAAASIAALWDAPLRYLIGIAGDVGLACEPDGQPC